MRPGKRSRNAKAREKLKKQRIDPGEDASDGSCYIPSEGEESLDLGSGDDVLVDATRKKQPERKVASENLRDALRALVELEGHDLSDSESDGEIMLGDGDVLDEDDWDPEVLPDLYPIFTQPNLSFKQAEQAIRAPVYTGNSRTTLWRRKVSVNKQMKEVKSCGDIRQYFLASPKVSPGINNGRSLGNSPLQEPPGFGGAG